MSQGLVHIFTGNDLKAHVKNIKCPLHHVIKPGCEPYKVEPNPLTKHFSKDALKHFGIKNWQYKKDKYGNKIPEYKNFYQPEISAAYAKERIYSNNHPTCRACRRCFV